MGLQSAGPVLVYAFRSRAQDLREMNTKEIHASTGEYQRVTISISNPYQLKGTQQLCETVKLNPYSNEPHAKNLSSQNHLRESESQF